MPRGREGCLARPAEGPGVAIQEALAAPAIGPRSETDSTLYSSVEAWATGLRTSASIKCGYRDP